MESPDRRINVLSLSTVYPHARNPRMGLFVRNRLEALAEFASVRVVVPRAWINVWGNGPDESTTPCDAGRVATCYPRWYYPPGLGGLNGLFLMLSLRRVVARLQRENPFDLIDAHFCHPEGVAAGSLAAINNVPFTVTLRGSELLHAESTVKWRLMRAALRRAAFVIAVSEQLRALAISAGVPENRTVTIPNGVDTRIFHPRDRQKARLALGMAENAKHILAVGHRIRLKEHAAIVEALAAVRASGINAELWIIGDRGHGEDTTPEILRKAELLRVESALHLLPGVRQEVLAEYMSACDLLCLASRREGWPNVVCEAQSCGAPVVATRVGAVPDMLDNPEYGIVVNPENPAELRDGLLQALTQEWDRRKIAERGGQRTWRHVAEQVMFVFERVLAEKPGARRRG